MSQCAAATGAGATRSSVFRRECSRAMVAAKPARYLNVWRARIRAPLCSMFSSVAPRIARDMAGRRYRHLDELRREHAEKGEQVRARLAEFRAMWREPDERLFEEVAYCILAIQTKARASEAAVRGVAER